MKANNNFNIVLHHLERPIQVGLIDHDLLGQAILDNGHWALSVEKLFCKSRQGQDLSFHKERPSGRRKMVRPRVQLSDICVFVITVPCVIVADRCRVRDHCEQNCFEAIEISTQLCGPHCLCSPHRLDASADLKCALHVSNDPGERVEVRRKPMFSSRHRSTLVSRQV